ncbi:histidinol-phosphate transaminase [Nonomuraea guangzhouensis]|uniref:Aromatic amino acid aminotransferase n=1 Tax=Nonomuraea guangzhouensis TaxID=1291555 RepID=A0ABW4FZ53_9ACTN|nr:histidinol-phosphate transaminase [Nonomuraea guangzhouensis]
MPHLPRVPDSKPAYTLGKGTASPLGRTHQLSSNESPYGPLPSVTEAIQAAGLEANRYPEPGCVRLTEALSRRHGVPYDHVALGPGSATVTQQLLNAICEPGDEVIYPWRSFDAYPMLADVARAVSVRVPLMGDDHDLDGMLTAITPSTRLVIVCNPNNPTGTVTRRAELTAFLDDVPENVLVVLDEAYREYAQGADFPDGVELYRDRPNVAVLRTFSKAYGLAGLRVGYLIGHPEVASAVCGTMVPYAVSAIAQAGALASLAAEDELMARVDEVVKERTRVRETLISWGWAVPDAEANFLWLRLGERSRAFGELCARAEVAVRAFDGEGVRVTIGEPAANDAFLTVAATVDTWS